MTAIYNKLGIRIMINAIVYASDVDDVQDFIVHELTRRRLGIRVTGAYAEDPANIMVLDCIDYNCRRAGYSGTAYSAEIPTASEIHRYIEFAKQLYRQNLRP